MDSSAKKRRSKGEGSEYSVRKKLRNSGQAYVTKKNKLVPARKSPNKSNLCKCKFNCNDIIYEQKIKLFQEYYALENNEKQSSYLLGLMHITQIKRRRHGTYNNPEDSKRKISVCFTVPNGNGDVEQVCRKTFENIFSITHRKVQTLTEKKKAGHVVYKEERGNKEKYRKFTEEDENLIVQHVNIFPREKSHYGRNKSQKQYLSPDLNINRLYRAFKEMYPEKENITYRFYYTTFKKHFPDLSFKLPRTDTCSTCDLLSAKIKSFPENKRELERKLELHHRKAEKAVQKMKEDFKESQLPTSSICTCAMDLQQVIFLPTLTHSRMFYLRQLSNYNFGIHIADNNEAIMHLWHEGISGRGSSEIASCILKLFQSSVITKKRLNMWSDNCTGQNKNKIILFLWIYLVANNILDEINHKFLVSGHSFLSCDRDFALIEKRKKVTKCYVPEDIVELIKSARENQPFSVTTMERENFYDFKKLSNHYINSQKLNISKLQWLKINKDNPGVIMVRETLSDLEPWKKISILKRGVTIQELKNMELPHQNSNPEISEEKRKNLKEMIDYLPNPEHKQFYQEIIGNI